MHVNLVKLAANNLLLSQTLVNSHLGLVLELEEKDKSLRKYAIDQILRTKNARG